MYKNVLIGIILLSTASCLTSSNFPKDAQTQEDLLFVELTEKGLYLGLSKADFLKICPNAEENPDGFKFRTILVDSNFSERFTHVIYYFDNDGKKPLYEIILIVNPELNANEVAKEHFGLPNHKNKEWRFPSVQTDLSFNLAAWTHKNKIIIAASIKGTEWENGIQ